MSTARRILIVEDTKGTGKADKVAVAAAVALEVRIGRPARDHGFTANPDRR
jgi:hypothetical protein